MGQLYQMQVSFDPLEDRLRFRLNTRSRTEFRFLLTRRYVRLLWQALWEMLKTRRQAKKSDSLAASPSPLPPEVAAAQSFEISLEHREAVKQGDFATPFHEGSSLPLGPGFILLSKVAVKNSPGGPQVLSIGPESGEGVDLTLDDRMLHSLCRLLADAAAKADWGIDLDFSAELRKLSGPPLN
ncbi:MAG: hypothetical protein R3F31_02450 [Verrucomicrobiales bacterium]